MKDASFWVEKSLNLTRRKGELEHALAGLEAEAAALMLDAEDETGGANTRGSLDMVERVQAEIRALDGAIRVCRARRLDAARDKRKADADELRKQAADLRADIARIDQKVRKHIESINALQETHVTVSATAPGEPTAKSQLLETQAMAIEARAAALDGDLPRHGTVTLDNVTAIDPLIAAVLMHASDGPSASDLASWAAAVERRAIAAGRGQFGRSPRRYYLVWKNSVIDTTESYIQVHGLARRPAGRISGEPVFEIGSDLFYARSAQAVA